MRPHNVNEISPALRELPEGMLEYEARTAIRDLIRLRGFEEARELVAYYLEDERTRHAPLS